MLYKLCKLINTYTNCKCKSCIQSARSVTCLSVCSLFVFTLVNLFCLCFSASVYQSYTVACDQPTFYLQIQRWIHFTCGIWNYFDLPFFSHIPERFAHSSGFYYPLGKYDHPHPRGQHSATFPVLKCTQVHVCSLSIIKPRNYNPLIKLDRKGTE